MPNKNRQEKWKEVQFNFKRTGNYRLEVSNFGNLAAYNKFSHGEPLKGTLINGYHIIRLKFFIPQDRKTKAVIDAKHEAIKALQEKASRWKLLLFQKKTKAGQVRKIKQQINTNRLKLKAMRTDLRKARASNLKVRTIHYQSFVHRLVAEYFCTAETTGHSVVGHLDYNKLNNKFSNLRWMTPQENYRHQQSSPYVIKEKKERASSASPRGAKLNIEKVKELKKLINMGKSVKSLVKKFGITDTQILRIKRGVNWAKVDAAK